MSVKNCENVEKSQVALTVEVSAADFEAAVEKAYRKQRGKISMPGFRPGKAPRKMIEKMYGTGVFYEDAVNEVIPEAYMEAVKEKDLKVVGYPNVELVGDVTENGFTFKATVAVYPEVTLGEYKGVEAPKAEVKVMAADVNARLKQMAEQNGRLVSVERKAKKGDTANIDFEGFDNGVPFDGGKGEGFDLELGSGQFVPGFEEQVIGMKAGEEKDLDITFPESYTPELAGKAVVFHVKVNTVSQKEIPTVDDEFAKDVSEFDTLAELKKDMKAKMITEREATAKREFEEALMAKVADGITVEIPDAMIEEQAQMFVENFARQLQSQGLDIQQYMKMSNTSPEDLLKQAKEPAEGQVRMDLAVAAIIKAENIEVTDEEIEAEYSRTAEQYGMGLEDVKKYLDRDLVSEQLLRSKAIKVVVESGVAVKPEPEKKAEEKTEE